MNVVFSVLGQPPSKSNSYRIGKFGNKATLVKSKHLKSYEAGFHVQIPCKYRGLLLEGRLRIELYCAFNWAAPDLDNASKILLDCLQSGQVIKNDNLVYELHMYKYIAKEFKTLSKQDVGVIISIDKQETQEVNMYEQLLAKLT
tara:strand:- start:629 stop:1060 length:432 start_codon:yes stop_codon:yes gene_type:complete